MAEFKNNYLTQETIELLQNAYLHEIHNMLLYEQISSWLDVMGFKNLGKYYHEWAEEEHQHGIWVKDFLSDLNIPLLNTNFDLLDFECNCSGLTDFAIKTVETEDETTKIYDNLLQVASDFEDSAMLSVFAKHMLKEQLEETKKSNNIKDMVINIGDNKALLQLFDNTFNS